MNRMTESGSGGHRVVTLQCLCPGLPCKFGQQHDAAISRMRWFCENRLATNCYDSDAGVTEARLLACESPMYSSPAPCAALSPCGSRTRGVRACTATLRVVSMPGNAAPVRWLLPLASCFLFLRIPFSPGRFFFHCTHYAFTPESQHE